jgi:hypothetical protein
MLLYLFYVRLFSNSRLAQQIGHLSMTQISEIGYALAQKLSWLPVDLLKRFIYHFQKPLHVDRLGHIAITTRLHGAFAVLRQCMRLRITGMDFVASSDFNFCEAVHPSISGMLKSIRIKSGFCNLAASTPSLPLTARKTS